nr:MAG TPA: hypothetical protein [Caudoviricetes sp.]
MFLFCYLKNTKLQHSYKYWNYLIFTLLPPF